MGADLCGIAPIDSFKEAPRGFHPADIFPSCKSVVVIAGRIPEGPFRSGSAVPYTAVNDALLQKVIHITVSMSLELEQHGAVCVPVPSEPYEYWDEENREGKGILSLKHAGKLAGLGTIGKNSLLTNRLLGNRMVLGALLMDLVVEHDEVDTAPRCGDECRACEDTCPVHAISGGMVNQKLCRGNSCTVNKKGYALYTCFECRSVCPHGSGVKK